jgi:hypothetical protein
VLSHYDGVEAKGTSLVLGLGGSVADRQRLQDLMADDDDDDGGGGGGRWGAAAAAVPQSLVVAKSVASDFLTAAEVNAQAFKKPKKLRKKKDKAAMRTKSSSSADGDEDAVGASAVGSSAMEDADGDVEDGGSRNRGSGGGSGGAATATAAAAAKLAAAFAAAKAAAAAKLDDGHVALLAAQHAAAAALSPPTNQAAAAAAPQADGDAELAAAMARVRGSDSNAWAFGTLSFETPPVSNLLATWFWSWFARAPSLSLFFSSLPGRCAAWPSCATRPPPRPSTRPSSKRSQQRRRPRLRPCAPKKRQRRCGGKAARGAFRLRAAPAAPAGRAGRAWKKTLRQARTRCAPAWQLARSCFVLLSFCCPFLSFPLSFSLCFRAFILPSCARDSFWRFVA